MFGATICSVPWHDPSLATLFGVHAGLCMGSIALCGSEEQQAEWLPKLRRWELVGVGNATLPLTLEVAIDGSRKRLIEGRLEVRTRGRLDDIKRIVWERPSGARVEDVTDTVTSPFTATAQALYLRRYALLAASDWVDTGTVADGELRLRARYLEQQFGPVRNLTLTYRKRP